MVDARPISGPRSDAYRLSLRAPKLNTMFRVTLSTHQGTIAGDASSSWQGPPLQIAYGPLVYRKYRPSTFLLATAVSDKAERNNIRPRCASDSAHRGHSYCRIHLRRFLWLQSFSKSAQLKAVTIQSCWLQSNSTSTERRQVEGPFDLSIELLDESPGYAALRFTGRDAASMSNEAGGHRWQRIPPTEKKGRVHTSTITIAVLPEDDVVSFRLDERDLEIRTCRGSGAGGQHRNVTASAVQVTHVPTGLQVRVESERSQAQNKASALALLRAKLQARQDESRVGQRNANRKAQVGVGARGDKRRTIALQRDSVVDHVTGKETTAKKYLRGEIEVLW